MFFKFNIEIIWYIKHSDIHCKTDNTTGNCHAASVEQYHRVLALVLTGKGIEEAVQELEYKSRTFGRKRSIAELMILEPEEFERIRERLARTSTGRRISQEELVIKCNEVLRKSHVQTKRRLAVAQGRLS